MLIATGAITDAAGVSTPFIAFLGNPVFALFAGMLDAYLLARHNLGRERTDEAIARGLETTGQILLITGIGGSLGAVIGATDLDQQLGSLFSAESGAPVVVTIMLAWLIAALLHFAIGSISVAAIAAAGILKPCARHPRRGVRRGRPGHRSRCALRPAGEQQLLLDVPEPARRVHAGRSEGADLRHRAGLGRGTADHHRPGLPRA